MDSTSPQRCGLIRTPRLTRARNKDSESAAQNSTSTCNSATLRASASGSSGPSTNSRRATSFPRRRVTRSKRAAVSSTGETRFCETGMAIVTPSRNALNMPASNWLADKSESPLKSKPIVVVNPDEEQIARGKMQRSTDPNHSNMRRLESVTACV